MDVDPCRPANGMSQRERMMILSCAHCARCYFIFVSLLFCLSVLNTFISFTSLSRVVPGLSTSPILYTLLLCWFFFLFYLVPVNMSVVQNLVITLLSVQ